MARLKLTAAVTGLASDAFRQRLPVEAGEEGAVDLEAVEAAEEEVVEAVEAVGEQVIRRLLTVSTCLTRREISLMRNGRHFLIMVATPTSIKPKNALTVAVGAVAVDTAEAVEAKGADGAAVVTYQPQELDSTMNNRTAITMAMEMMIRTAPLVVVIAEATTGEVSDAAHTADDYTPNWQLPWFSFGHCQVSHGGGDDNGNRTWRRLGNRGFLLRLGARFQATLADRLTRYKTSQQQAT